MNGAMVRKSVDQTSADYSAFTALTFDTEVYDVGGWFNSGTSATRFVVPSGVDHIALAGSMNVKNASGGSDCAVRLTKNGSVFKGGGSYHAQYTLGEITGNGRYINIATGAIPVTAGDYFEILLDSENDTSVDITAAETYFSIRAVTVGSGVMVSKSADQTTADYSSGATMTFDQEVYDVGGWFNSGTSNTDLVVPAGVNRIVASAIVQWALAAAASTGAVTLLKDGAASFTGRIGSSQRSGFTGGNAFFVSPPIDVTPGDTFQLFFSLPGDSSITIEAGNLGFGIYAV